MDEARETRKLVKARLLPEIHAALVAYAAAKRRSVSSAVEYLIEQGLAAEGASAPDDLHHR